MAHARQQRGAGASDQHDEHPDDVVALAEDVVDFAEHDGQADRQHSEPGDLRRAGSDCGDERSDDQCAHDDGVGRHEVDEHDDRHRGEAGGDPPPRL